jgi:hypothetical protein
MLSLAKLITENAEHLADQIDKSPSQQRLAILENESKLAGCHCRRDLVNAVLRSGDLSRILWGFSTLIKMSRTDLTFVAMVPAVVEKFSHPSKNL